MSDHALPGTYTCAVVKECTTRAITFVSLGHGVVVWACDEHRNGPTE